MKILLTFNTAYAPHAAAIITGILKYASQPVSVVVMYDELSEDAKERLTSYYGKKLTSLEFIKVEIETQLKERILSLKTLGHLNNINTYLRLFAANYIKDDYVIYMDCDIVVADDIFKMLEEVDNHFYVCGVKEYDPLHRYNDFSLVESWMKPSVENYLQWSSHYFRNYVYYDRAHDKPYLSAGIMYMNLKKWREDCLFDKIVATIYKYDIFYAADQDVLNATLRGEFGIINPKWNTIACNLGIMSNYPSQLIKEAREKPSIDHMPGMAKPWNINLGGNSRNNYWKYRKESPWPEIPFRPTYVYLFDLVVRCYNKIMRSISSVIFKMQYIKKTNKSEIYSTYM